MLLYKLSILIFTSFYVQSYVVFKNWYIILHHMHSFFNLCIAFKVFTNSMATALPQVISFTDSPSVPTVIRFLNSGQRLFGDSAKVHERQEGARWRALARCGFGFGIIPKEVFFNHRNAGKFSVVRNSDRKIRMMNLTFMSLLANLI